jgi:hypothetical protein
LTEQALSNGRSIVEKIPANKAKQGRQGTQVFLVLVVGLVLAGAVWLGLEFFGEAIDTQSADQPGGIQTDTGQTGQQPAPAQ